MEHLMDNPAIWIAIVGIGGTLLSPVITSTLTLRAEESRQRHERQMERERREHEDRVQRRQDRLAAYERFMRLITLVSAGGRVSWDEIADSYSAVELRASDGVAQRARELFLMSVDAAGTKKEDEQKEMMTRLREKRWEFRAAAKKELES
jgi:hypothetical protein